MNFDQWTAYQLALGIFLGVAAVGALLLLCAVWTGRRLRRQRPPPQWWCDRCGPVPGEEVVGPFDRPDTRAHETCNGGRVSLWTAGVTPAGFVREQRAPGAPIVRK